MLAMLLVFDEAVHAMEAKHILMRSAAQSTTQCIVRVVVFPLRDFFVKSQ